MPDKVTDLKVTNVTASTISIRWQVAFSGNSPISSYLVQYQSDDPLDDLLMQTSAGLQSPSQTSLQSLRQASMMASSNQLMIGPESLGSAPSQPNVAGDGARPTSNSAANQRQQQQQQATDKSATTTTGGPSSALKAALEALNIESNLDGVDEAIDRTLVELTIQQSSTHLVVKDLNPYCVYRLRLAGINKIGLGEFSDWIRAKTEEAAPSGAALKINAAATGPNSIKLTWNPPDRRSWNGHLIGFNVAYRPIDSSFELNKTIEWAPPSLQSLIIDNHEMIMADKRLKVKQQQQQQQLKSNSSDQSDSTAMKQRQATASADKQQTNSSQSNGEPAANGYTLRQHLKQLLALQQQELVAHLTNLQRSTTYLVWIQSMNNRGLSPQSHAINVRTLDDVPPSAPTITIQSATSNSVTIAWSLLSNFVSTANQYSLFYRRVPLQQQLGAIVGSGGSYNHRLKQSPEPISGQANLNLNLEASKALLDSNQLIESSPFIERIISGQQLMLMNAAAANIGGSSFEFADQFENNLQQHQDLKATLLMTQSHQHYQQFVYTLDELDCGSAYELYMTTRNSVGKSEPSPVVTTRTLGEPPLAPSSKSNLFAKIGINEVTLNLAAWSTGGCPLTHLTVRYKQAPMPAAASISIGGHQLPASNVNQSQPSSSTAPSPVSWPISISLSPSVLESINVNQANTKVKQHYPTQHHNNNNNNEHSNSQSSGPVILQPVYTLRNLLPSTAYDLEIAAYNAAGHTTAQYEFVTSNSNGSRIGFSRKEGVYRLDQRGFPLEDLTDSAHGSGSILEQQQVAFNNQSGSNGQLIQLLLMPLCFIIVLLSAYCYYRVRDSRKSNRNSSSPDGTIAAGAQSVRGTTINCHHSSPGSIGKSSMWRIDNQLNNNQQRGNSASMMKRHHHHHVVDDMDASSGAVHYCVRDPNQTATTGTLGSGLMLKQQPSSFSQSVSMKDFNLIDSSLQNNISNSNSNNNASTLNFENYNRTINRDANKTAATLRNGRLSNYDNYDHNYTHFNELTPAVDHNQVCSVYGSCKQQNQSMAKLEQNVGLLAGQRPGVGGLAQASDCNAAMIQQQYHVHQAHQCNNFPGQDNFQQQETSWTNYEPQYAVRQPTATTNYAIPISADKTILSYNNGFDQQQQQQQYDGYGQMARSDPDRTICGESSIDACIQQLMSQQYQEQQQQQQQYAMIVNMKPDKQDANRCLYDTNENFNNHHTTNQVNLTRLDNLPSTAQAPIEGAAINQNSSSSSSSGIDSGGAHPDCASTTTGTSHSNTSNDGYQLTHPM